MSNPKEGENFDATIPTAVPVDTPPSPAEVKAPTFGIEVSPSKVYDEKTNTHHDACTVNISPGIFLRDLLSWMKQYQVGKTLREWAKQIKWKEEVWKPLKDWSKTVKWKEEVINPVKEGMHQVNWEEEVWKPVKEVDWNKIHQDIQEATKDVDWQDARTQLKESLKTVDWGEIHREVKGGLEQVDWSTVQKEVKEWKDIIGWDEVKDDVQEHFSRAAELCKEVKDEVEREIDWEHVKKADSTGNANR